MRRTELPPVHRVAFHGHLAQRASGALDAGAAAREPAELPQLARRPLVLVEDLVEVVGVLLAGPEEIDGFGDPLDELAQARLVV